MSLKEKLLELKERILSKEVLVPRALEFDATLEDHPIGSQYIYRLYFVNYHRIGESYGKNTNYNLSSW